MTDSKLPFSEQHEPQGLPLDTQECRRLLALARRLATRQHYAHAVSLCQIALDAAPSDDVRAFLDELRPLVRSDESTPSLDEIKEQARRSAIDASHYLGLAALYAERGDVSEALECIQMSKEKGRMLPYPYKLHGRMLIRQRDYEGAARELRMARRLNPFDAQTGELLGRVEYERKRFVDSLEATIDAFLLLDEKSSDRARRLRRRIRTLKRVLRWDNRRLLRLFRERQENLNTAFDRLRWRRDLFLEESGLIDRSFLFQGTTARTGGTRIEIAGLMRRTPALAPLADETVFELTQFVHAETRDKGDTVYGHGSEDSSLYLLDRGRAESRRPTPYGSFSMGVLEAGSILGTVNFADPAAQPTEVVALEPCRLLRIDGPRVREVFDDRPDLGVQLFTSVWQTLAHDLRQTNDLLGGFFASGDGEARPAVKRRATSSEEAHEVQMGEKVKLFREHGLSRKELLTLATFANERHFPEGSVVFREGDAGSSMYVVLDGAIRISKFIPGGGEEALAILERGDFLGEMALIDGLPRSADARAHRGPATVLELQRDTVSEVLAMDAHAALDFLHLLCRILAARQREVDEKLVLWKILAQHDQPDHFGMR